VIPDITDPFTAANGALNATSPTDHSGSGAYVWTAANWTITSNAAAPNPTESAQKFADADFESATVPGSWATMAATLNERSTEQAHGGTYSRKVTAGVAQGIRQVMSTGITDMTFVKAKAWMYLSAGKCNVNNGGASSADITTTGSWQQVTTTGRYRASGANAFGLYANQAASTYYCDDAELYELTHGDCFATLDTRRADQWSLSAGATFEQCQLCGLVACLDSATSPASYVILWHNRIAVIAEKIVAGVRTSLVSTVTNVTYVAGARFGISRDGNTFSFFYNGVLQGTATVTDAQIVNNTRHGIFSTLPASTLDAFRFRSARARRIAILGDSISNSITTDVDWPYHLVRDSAIGCVDCKNHAVSGQTVLTHMDAQTTASASDNADAIIVLLGINDTTSTGFEAEYTENLNELHSSNPNATIYALGLLPNSGTPYVERRTTYNPLIAAAASAAGANYVDTAGWIDPATDTSDGLHPNATGAAKVVTALKNIVSF
jgi:hypothetical protein